MSKDVGIINLDEVIAMLKLWLKRLDYSDPYNDKPKVKALLERLGVSLAP